MALALGVGPIDHADRAFQPGLLQRLHGRILLGQVEPEVGDAHLVEQMFVAAFQPGRTCFRSAGRCQPDAAVTVPM